MKALIISDDSNVVSPIDSFFKKNGFDTIVYKWLMKALDNIEEIQPDIIVLNSSEYPRHWKTLVSFVNSGLGGNNVKVFLFEPNPLSEDEYKKFLELGVAGYFTDLSEDSLGVLAGKEPEKKEIGKIIITNPEFGNLCFGILYSLKDKVLCCKIQDSNLKINQILKYVSFVIDDCYKSGSAVITSISEDLMELKIQDYYEEI